VSWTDTIVCLGMMALDAFALWVMDR